MEEMLPWQNAPELRLPLLIGILLAACQQGSAAA